MRRASIDASLDRVAQDWGVLRAAPDFAVLPRRTLLAAAVLGARAEVVEGVGEDVGRDGPAVRTRALRPRVGALALLEALRRVAVALRSLL